MADNPTTPRLPLARGCGGEPCGWAVTMNKWRLMKAKCIFCGEAIDSTESVPYPGGDRACEECDEAYQAKRARQREQLESWGVPAVKRD